MEMFKGDNRSWEVTVNKDGTPENITGSEVVFTTRPELGSSTKSIERKNAAAGGSADEIEMSDPANGKFKLHLVPANTTDLAANEYNYDFQLTLGGIVSTIIRDVLILKEDVTK